MDVAQTMALLETMRARLSFRSLDDGLCEVTAGFRYPGADELLYELPAEIEELVIFSPFDAFAELTHVREDGTIARWNLDAGRENGPFCDQGWGLDVSVRMPEAHAAKGHWIGVAQLGFGHPYHPDAVSAALAWRGEGTRRDVEDTLELPPWTEPDGLLVPEPHEFETLSCTWVDAAPEETSTLGSESGPRAPFVRALGGRYGGWSGSPYAHHPDCDRWAVVRDPCRGDTRPSRQTLDIHLPRGPRVEMVLPREFCGPYAVLPDGRVLLGCRDGELWLADPDAGRLFHLASPEPRGTIGHDFFLFSADDDDVHVWSTESERLTLPRKTG